MRRLWLVVVGGLSVLLAAGCGKEPFDGISITAVELRAAPRLEFLHARDGMRFLEVRFEFENKTGEPVVLKALDFSLRDTAGTLYPFSAQVLDMGQPRAQTDVTVPPKQRVSGSIVFQVPWKASPGELIYRQEKDGGLSVRLLSGG
ncbi:MAG TPA: DUF4352 domain-containing protein [Candidatus Polarisedimenticolia bacterium]|nr:DUF4352 domain-containing protein [Candidatus Polarisedimenticolia bacterium]